MPEIHLGRPIHALRDYLQVAATIFDWCVIHLDGALDGIDGRHAEQM